MLEKTELGKKFDEKLKVSEGYWDFIRQAALDTERFFHNMQTGTTRHGGLNMARNIFLSFVSRQMEDSPAVKGFPKTNAAIPKVKIAEAVYRHVSEAQEFDKGDFQLALRGLKQGSAAQFVYWDPDAGDDLMTEQRDELGDFILDDDGKTPKMKVSGKVGSVAVRDLGGTEFCYGPGGDITKAKWVVMRLTFSREELETYLEENPELAESVIEDKDTQDNIGTWLGVSGDTERKYTLYDFWHVKAGKFNGGRGIYTDNGIPLREGEWPLEHMTLPLAVYHVCQIEGLPIGSSPAWDLIPIQKEYDKLEVKKEEHVKMQRIYAFSTAEVFNQLDKAENSRIKVGSIGATQGGLIYSKPPPVPAYITERSAELVRQGFDTMGLNEALVGAESAKSNWSAKLIAFLNRLDSQKQRGAMLSWRAFQTRRANLVARTYHANAAIERTIMIAGEENEWEAQTFNGSTFTDVDFIFEQVPGQDVLRSVAAAEAKDDMQAGRISLEDGLERAETGLGETMGQHGNSRQVRKYIEDAMVSPAQATPPPGMDPQEIIAEAEIMRTQPEANQSALDEIISKAKAALAQAAQEQANANPSNPGAR